jgi:hypothetical protein
MTYRGKGFFAHRCPSLKQGHGKPTLDQHCYLHATSTLQEEKATCFCERANRIQQRGVMEGNENLSWVQSDACNLLHQA